MVPGEKMRRVGVIGDVHAEHARLEQALGFLRAREADLICCVGDLVDGGGDADRACDLLREHAIPTVLGNHERWFLTGDAPAGVKQTESLTAANREFLRSLPATLPISTVAGPALLCHGVGDDDMAELFPDTRGYALMDIPTLRELMIDPDVTYMIAGHTHQRMVRRFSGLTVVNAGTLHRGFAAGFIEIDFSQKEVQCFDFEGDEILERESRELPDPAPL